MSAALRLGGVLVGLCLLGETAVADSGSLPEVHIGAGDWRPYFYGGRTDGPPGSAVEIFDICLPRLGFTPRFVPATVEEIFQGLQAGRFQVHVLSYRPERAEYLAYGDEPMFFSGYRPFVGAGVELEGKGPEQFDGLKLAVRPELRFDDALDAYLRGRLERQEGVLEVETDEEALQAVADGRADATPLMLSTALRHRRRLGLEDAVRVVMDQDLKTADYRVAVSKAQTVIPDPKAFLDGMDACLVELKESGKYDEIGDRYADLIE